MASKISGTNITEEAMRDVNDFNFSFLFLRK
jgi:hypothetical protein